MQHTLAAPQPAALSTQEGGNHYKDLAIQPVEYIHKNGVEDLKKARHFLDILIEMEAQGVEVAK